MAPSPAAEVTRLIDPLRTSPTANTPGWLVSSSDGVKYDLITHLDVPGHANESTIRFLPDGQMVALVRRALQASARVLVNSYVCYAPVPAQTWHDMHAIYAFATFLFLLAVAFTVYLFLTGGQ